MISVALLEENNQGRTEASNIQESLALANSPPSLVRHAHFILTRLSPETRSRRAFTEQRSGIA